MKSDNFSIFSKTEIESAFRYAFHHNRLIELDKLAKILNYTDDFVWKMAVSHLNPKVFVEYIERIPIPGVCIIDWFDHNSNRLVEIVRLCLNHKINILFRRPAKAVIEQLCATDDIKIWEFLLTTYPEYQRLNPNHVYDYPLIYQGSIYFSQTFLTMAIWHCSLKCLPLILNTCPCFDEFHISFHRMCLAKMLTCLYGVMNIH